MSEQFQGENLDAVTRRMKEGGDDDADFQGENLDRVTERMKDAGTPDDDLVEEREAGLNTSAVNQRAQDADEDALRERRDSLDEQGRDGGV